MDYKIISIFIFIFTLSVKNSNGQFAAVNNGKCSADSPCTLLSQCPTMLALIQSGIGANVQKVQKSICGFSGRRSKVCCKEEDNPPLTPEGGDSLLPKDCGRPEVFDRIVGGEIAPKGSYPWMVAMAYDVGFGRDEEFLCAGSLINNRYVLTAAHCIDKSLLGTRKLNTLYLGDWDLSSPIDCQVTQLGQDCSPPHDVRGVEEEIMHPQYDVRAISSDDVALIRMDAPVTLRTQIQPVCLPPPNLSARRAANGGKPVAAGWGITENNTQSNIMKRVFLPFNSDQICKDLYKARFVSKQLCVGGVGGEDTCSGDSGGPLVVSGPHGPPFLQLGIVSFGPVPCGLSKKPAVYASVSDYKNWIVQNLKP